MFRPCLALLLVAAAPAVRAQVAVLAPDSDARWVPFEWTDGNQMRFAVTINGRVAAAILDTGVSTSVVSPGFAAAAGLRVVARGQATAIGGPVAVGWAAVGRVAFGGLDRRGGRLAVAELNGIGGGATTPAAVLIGADMLAPHALEIDADARRFRLLPSGRLPFAGVAVPLAIAPASGLYVSEIAIGAHRLRPVVVDTGDGSAVTVPDAAWRAAAPAGVVETSGYAHGLGGGIETGLAILPALRLGRLTARAVEVRIEPPGGFAHATGTAGRIGAGLLGRYRVLLDPAAGRMVLSPGGTADAAPPRSTSGLLLEGAGAALRVVHVMRASPAAAGGWRAGDRICAVDGVRVGDPRADAAWPAGTPGRTVRLLPCDDTGERTLTLAHFY